MFGPSPRFVRHTQPHVSLPPLSTVLRASVYAVTVSRFECTGAIDWGRAPRGDRRGVARAWCVVRCVESQWRYETWVRTFFKMPTYNESASDRNGIHTQTACRPTPYATLHMLSFGGASQLGGRCRASIARRASACLRLSSAPPTSAASKPAARHSTPLIAHDLSSIPTASARFSSPLAYSVEVEGHALGATEAAGTEESAAGRSRFAASSCIARVCRDQERGD